MRSACPRYADGPGAVTSGAVVSARSRADLRASAAQARARSTVTSWSLCERAVDAVDDRLDEILGDADVGVRVAQADRADADGVAADRTGEQRAEVIRRHAVLLAEADEQARLVAVRGGRGALRRACCASCSSLRPCARGFASDFVSDFFACAIVLRRRVLARPSCRGHGRGRDHAASLRSSDDASAVSRRSAPRCCRGLAGRLLLGPRLPELAGLARSRRRRRACPCFLPRSARSAAA